MHNLFGISFNVDSCQDDEVCGYKWLTFVVIGLSSALLVALIYGWVRQQTNSTYWALLITLLFTFGTMIWPYSLVFNNHIPAALCLFASLLMLPRGTQAPSASGLRLFWAGLLAGLAVSFDLTTVFIALALFILTSLNQRRVAVTFALGGTIPALMTMIFDYQIWQSVLPPYFATEGYDYPGSPWSSTVAAMRPPKNIWLYSFRALLGDHGFLSHSPLLLWPIISMMLIIRNRNHPQWRAALFLIGAMVVYTIVILTRTDNFGGKAYGARFFIPLIPLLFYFIPFTLPLDFKSLRGKLLGAVIVVAVLISTVSAYQGVLDTWERVKPILFLQARPYNPYLTICSNQNTGACLDAVLNRCAWANVGYVEREFDPPSEMQRTLDANFADQMMLLGYDLTSRRLKAGEALSLIVYWQSLQPLEQDYLQFNHLFGSSSRAVWWL